MSDFHYLDGNQLRIGLKPALPERIYNPITAMGFSAMFTFQLYNIAVMGVVDTFGPGLFPIVICKMRKALLSSK